MHIRRTSQQDQRDQSTFFGLTLMEGKLIVVSYRYNGLSSDHLNPDAQISGRLSTGGLSHHALSNEGRRSVN